MAIFYAAAAIQDGPAETRIDRQAQSLTARALQARLTGALGEPVASSRSHSRNMAAAAIASAPVDRLGVDVERIDPARRTDEIASLYLGEAVTGLPLGVFFRGWTFGEAHFKALGRNPSPALLRRVLNSRAEPETVWEVEPGLWTLHARVGAEFVLSLVWAAPQSVSVRRLQA